MFTKVKWWTAGRPFHFLHPSIMDVVSDKHHSGWTVFVEFGDIGLSLLAEPHLDIFSELRLPPVMQTQTIIPPPPKNSVAISTAIWDSLLQLVLTIHLQVVGRARHRYLKMPKMNNKKLLTVSGDDRECPRL